MGFSEPRSTSIPRRRRRAYLTYLTYLTDLTGRQRALIAPLIPDAEPGGRPRKAAERELVDAILYLLRAAAPGGSCPTTPPWQTVYYYFRRWQREGVWARVQHMLVMADRERAGRDASPYAAILDSQTVRTADQKGDSRGSMRARRSMGASGTS